MVHTNVVGAAAAGSSSARPPFRPRLASRGSFHAGDIFPSFDSVGRRESLDRRRSVTGTRRSSGNKYHTFPTPPPKAPSEDSNQNDDDGRTPSRSGREGDHHHHRHRGQASGHEGSHDRDTTPLPIRQLGLLALLSLAEQTALNSISPYLPTMVESFAEIPDDEMGLYVGLLASTFALAQLATNLFWGYLSDAIGRKPVMLMGSFLLMLCFCFFGFCTSYWQVVVIHVAMGLLNGNAAVVPTCLGEVTDRTNQSSAFTWLPVVYSLGSITGPALGGLLAGRPGSKYPFLAPNIGSAVLLGITVVILGLWFDETLDNCDRRTLPPSLVWIDDFWKWCCCLTAGSDPSTPAEQTPESQSESSLLLGDGISEEETHSGDAEDEDEEDGNSKAYGKKSAVQQLLNHKTVILLLTYLVFQLSNISFNSLYPIFSAAPPPTGRDLPPGEIGLLLSFAGFATILFQITVFQPLKAKMGNLGSYRGALFGLALSMMLMPWVSHTGDPPLFGIGTSEWWLYIEVAAVLVIKNICAVGGLSSVMLLTNNSAPSHETLGTLNGIAQTLSAAGRSIGPFLSGALFSVSTRIQPKGELLAWCIFGGISALGWLLSLVINGQGLESADWEGAEDGDDGQYTDEEGLRRDE